MEEIAAGGGGGGGTDGEVAQEPGLFLFKVADDLDVHREESVVVLDVAQKGRRRRRRSRKSRKSPLLVLFASMMMKKQRLERNRVVVENPFVDGFDDVMAVVRQFVLLFLKSVDGVDRFDRRGRSMIIAVLPQGHPK